MGANWSKSGKNASQLSSVCLKIEKQWSDWASSSLLCLSLPFSCCGYIFKFREVEVCAVNTPGYCWIQIPSCWFHIECLIILFWEIAWGTFSVMFYNLSCRPGLSLHPPLLSLDLSKLTVVYLYRFTLAMDTDLHWLMNYEAHVTFLPLFCFLYSLCL